MSEPADLRYARLKSWALAILAKGRPISMDELRALSNDDLDLLKKVMLDMTDNVTRRGS